MALLFLLFLNNLNVLTDLEQENRTCILVLGMHRSGTSAITGALNCLGFSIGKFIMGGIDENNEKGFFENIRLYRFNKNIFKEQALTWDTSNYIDFDQMKNSQSRTYRLELKKIIRREFKEDPSNLVIKDPRICLLLPLYLRALKELGIEVRILFQIREPSQIATSLKKRDNLDVDNSYRISINYLLQAELNSRGYKRYVVTYKELMQTPQETLNASLAKLNLAHNNDFKSVSDLLDDKLYHNRNVELIPSGEHRTIRSIYSLLDKSRLEWQGGTDFILDELRTNFYRRLSLEKVNEEKDKQILKLQKELRTEKKNISAFRKKLKNRNTQILELQKKQENDSK